MKKLTLIRHAKTLAPDHKQTDFDRSLSEQGHQDVETMTGRLEKQNFAFDQLFCSSAQRAISTAQVIFGRLASNDLPMRDEMTLYNIDLGHLYRFIETIDSTVQHAVLVAHNPALSDLLNDLLRDPIQNMQPCAIAQLQLNINDWIEIQTGCGQLLSFDSPS